MNRTLGKVRIGLSDHKGAFGDFKRMNFMRDIDDLNTRRDAQDDALHGCDEVVGGAEVCGEGDDPPGHNLIIAVDVCVFAVGSKLSYLSGSS